MKILGIAGFFLLTLLKILLLILLAVLVLVIVILSFSIRYEATGRAEGPAFGEGLEAHVRVTALLGLASLRGILRGGDVLYSFRIAGKTIRKGRKLKNDSREAAEFSDEEASAEPEESAGSEMRSEAEIHAGTERNADTGTEARSGADDEAGTDAETGADAAGEEASGREALSGLEDGPDVKKAAGRRKKKKHRKAKTTAESPKEEKTLSEKLSAGWEKAEKGWEKLQEPSFRKTLRRIKRAAGRILRHILPQELRGKAVAGTGDPALTGQLIGLFYACWPLYGDRWDLELAGDFEKKRLQGKVYMKGRIRPVTIIGIVLSLLPDKNILRLIWSRRKRKKG